MNGNFSQEAMEAFTAMVGEENFSEGLFDFTTCQRPDGSKYGTSGHCRKGTQTETVARTPSGRRGTPKQKAMKELATRIKRQETAIARMSPGKYTKKEIDIEKQTLQEMKSKLAGMKSTTRTPKPKATKKAVASVTTPKPLRGQHLANMMKDHLNIENSVRANHGGGLQTKAAKEEFAAALKKAGVPDKATIKAALVAQRDEERAGKA
jgi:hypothetical protein